MTRSRGLFSQVVKRPGIIIFSLLLALFFLFVGYMKAFASLAELAQHHAWTVHLPQLVGRAIGWSEMLCALLLLIGMFRPVAGRIGAAALLLNQMAAAAMHIWAGEIRSLPQNMAIILICIVILYCQSRPRIAAPGGMAPLHDRR